MTSIFFFFFKKMNMMVSIVDRQEISISYYKIDPHTIFIYNICINKIKNYIDIWFRKVKKLGQRNKDHNCGFQAHRII